MKQIKSELNFSSITCNPKWLVGIEINNFSSRREKDNSLFYKKIAKLINDYNNLNGQFNGK